MSTLKTRIIKRENGEVVVKTTSVFSAEEAKNIPRIADDSNVVWSIFRDRTPSVVLTYLRIFHFWADIWENRALHSKMILEGVERKRAKAKRAEGKKRRRK